MLFLKCKMSELPTFREFVNQYNWARPIDSEIIVKRASKILSTLRDTKKPSETPINNKISSILKKNIKINSNTYWRNHADRIKPELAKFKFYDLVDPNEVTRNDIKNNNVLMIDKSYKEADIVVSGKKAPLTNNFKLSEVISDYDAVDPKVMTKEEADKAAREDRKKARIKAAQEIVDKFEKKHGEKTVEEQLKNTVTKIAKNKQLMDLSKEQLRDYLRDAYEITDENALNNMMNAVVAKRAELFANNQLKQEELTEIDISKLQEQSQRDFEKKLNDQNLRYILPAQIEKRERLVQNRLNPELLKSGY